MTIAKSLKYEAEENGKGYVHRTHRSKKQRKALWAKEAALERKKKIEELRLKDLDTL
jgi:hypothetical protein